ncbi:MAG: 2-amino-4-hydroxy-6-hydroxymethyldihydropteridine diphosphokinase [Pirellulales bacterium]
MSRSLVALGANLGERQRTLTRTVEMLAAEKTISNLAVSRFHETAPVGGPLGQGAFLNAVVALDTVLSPQELHELLKRIEMVLGRLPAVRWAPRTIDLDLLLFDDAIVCTPTLAVPHPRMAFRRFVLAPAAEVAPEMVHPLVGLSVAELLAHLNAAAPYVALLGMPDSGRSWLARAAARAVGGSYLAAPADPSGHVPPRPIQFLDRAAGLLANHHWRAAPGVVVSDFYFDECLAYARMDLDDRQYERFRQSWAAVRERVVRPKLLVVLDTWEQGVNARSNAPPLGGDAQAADRLRRELLVLAARGEGGPVLYAGRDDPQVQLHEITAAIAAMG